MWPQIVNLPVEECLIKLREMELDSYMRLLSVLRARGAPREAERSVLSQLTALFDISDERAKAEIRRVANDEKLAALSQRLTGRDWSEEWVREGGPSMCGRIIRPPPQTVNTPLADKIARLTVARYKRAPVPVPSTSVTINPLVECKRTVADKDVTISKLSLSDLPSDEQCFLICQTDDGGRVEKEERNIESRLISRESDVEEVRLALDGRDDENDTDSGSQLSLKLPVRKRPVRGVTSGGIKCRRRPSSLELDKGGGNSTSDAVSSSPIFPQLQTSPSSISSKEGKHVQEDIPEELVSPSSTFESRISLTNMMEVKDIMSTATYKLESVVLSGRNSPRLSTFQSSSGDGSPLPMLQDDGGGTSDPATFWDGITEPPGPSTSQDCEDGGSNHLSSMFSTSPFCPNRRRLPECRVLLRRAHPPPYKRMRRKLDDDPTVQLERDASSSSSGTITWSPEIAADCPGSPSSLSLEGSGGVSSNGPSSPVDQSSLGETNDSANSKVEGGMVEHVLAATATKEVSSPLSSSLVGSNIVISVESHSGSLNTENLESNEQAMDSENSQSVAEYPLDSVVFGDSNSSIAVDFENNEAVNLESSQIVDCDPNLLLYGGYENSLSTVGIENSETVILENTQNAGFVQDTVVCTEDQNGCIENKSSVNSCIVPAVNKSSSTAKSPTSVPMPGIPVSCIISKGDGSNIRIFKLRHDPTKTRFIKMNSSQSQLRGLVHKLLSNKRKLEEDLETVNIVHTPLNKMMNLTPTEDCVNNSTEFANSSYDRQNYVERGTCVGEGSLPFDNVPETTVVRNCLTERTRLGTQFNVIGNSVHKQPDCNDSHRSPYVPGARI